MNTIPDTELDENKKVYNYGDHAVFVDHALDVVKILWKCGSCRRFAARDYGTYSICEFCATPRRQTRHGQEEEKEQLQ